MNILFLTAGTGSVYAGSALRDNTLALEWLRSGGHHVTLVPLYTPTLTDERNVSQRRVFFGSIYLQQHMPIVRRTPNMFGRLWDSAPLIRAVARRQTVGDARWRGESMVAMLEPERGTLKRELERLVAWLGTLPEPDIICLSSALLIGLARPLRQALGARVCCLVSDEDDAIDRLHEPWRNEALSLIRRQVGEIEMFAACSRETATFMASYFGIAPERVRTAPLGITTQDFDRALGRRANGRSTAKSSGSSANGKSGGGGNGSSRTNVTLFSPFAESRAAAAAAAAASRPFTIGYLARIAPEKGLDVLVQAYRLLRAERGIPSIRLEIAGALPPEHRDYFAQIEKRLHEWGFAGDYRYHGVVTRSAKVTFYTQLDAFSMPAISREPKGHSVLEAMACGVPVVQPRRGACIDIIESTGGGLLVGAAVPSETAYNAECIAEGLWQLWQDRALLERCSDDAADEVRDRYSAWHSATRLAALLDEARRGIPVPPRTLHA